ncbi:MarR family winged helix-turn-helix transcriptional regulator [Nocardioides limicola]|uniref:MarR family winged helix-turn-helix transcriptional regulator n=1 Tax=Nocardioides limicola TaxID=2803368 RepID=UPI00193C5CD5|nr:MarR family transcriptional regulator [Nocardioides sp. DJM-14]
MRSNTGLATQLRVSMVRLNRRIRHQQDPGLDVTFTGLAVLAHLSREGDTLIGELAAVEHVRPPSMTRTVAALEAAGFVVRGPHPTDGRQVVVSITDAGQAVIEAERRRRDAWLAQRLAGLTDDEREVLRRAIPIIERLAGRSDPPTDQEDDPR